MFKKFVQVTALFNFPIAIGIMIPVLLSPKPDTLITTVVLAAFLMATGAALLWAAHDVKNRAPIIVWNGLVRCVGFVVVAYAASLDMSPKVFVVIGGMDLITATLYVAGSIKYSGQTFKTLFWGRSISQ